MDGLTLTKITRLLNAELAGSKLNRVGVTDDSLYLSLYADGVKCLRIRTGDLPALFPTDKCDGASSERLEILNGASLKSIDCRKYDRLVRFTFLKRRPSGKIIKYTLMAELMGRMSNAILVDGEGSVIYMLNKTNADADRQLGIGEKYITPKMNKRLNLENHENCGRFAELAGFYPLTVKHAEKLEATVFTFQEVCLYINSCLIDDDKFYTTENGKVIPFKSPDTVEVIDLATYAKVMSGDTELKKSGAAKKRLLKFYEKQKKKYTQLTKELNKELETAKTWNSIYEQGVLLRDNLNDIQGRTGELELNFYTAEGIEKRIFKLPEGENPASLTSKLFKKAAKMERSVFKVEERIKEVEQFLEGIDEQIYFIENSAGEEELLALEDEMRRGDKLQTKELKQKQFMTFILPFGKAYLGRNSVTNHRLVFQFAKPEDYWFHAQKIPSAHLILRTTEQITDEHIALCASIVASFSKYKNEAKVTVDYTRKKHVKKPKGTPPGFVIYHRFGSVTVPPATDQILETYKEQV
jgi:predicted ribosome quality control (RQC) complex YloA/Tae2 family protein